MSEEAAAGTPATDAATTDDGENQEEVSEAQEHRQKAWAARRDLIEHGPSFVSSLVGRDQYGVAGGTVQGNVIQHFGGRNDAPGPASGPVPREKLSCRRCAGQAASTRSTRAPRPRRPYSGPWTRPSRPATPRGLRITCPIRLRRDAAERSHQSGLRTARHEAEATPPEHRVPVMRLEHEAQIGAEKITFYEHHLAKGGTAALALHLAEHPDDTRLVLEHLRADQAELVQTQLHLIDQVLENKGLERHQLEEPRKLIAERMTAILRAPATAEETLPAYPQSPAEAPPESET
ncbi:hypothetical protein [Streptomyces sp. NPDC055134]